MPVSCLRNELRRHLVPDPLMAPPPPTTPRALLHVFNRYRFRGGEEMIVDKIHADLSTRYEMTWCRFESAAWAGPEAPSAFRQAVRLFYNKDAREKFEAALQSSGAGAAVFHNIHPVGSPSLYHAAARRGLPVVQFLHNYRPFSVGGTLFVNGKITPDALYGSLHKEVLVGAWQGSVVKSALFAMMVRALRLSRWTNSVKAWIAVSDFMREKLVGSGALPAARTHTLRHCWNAMSQPPQSEDAGYYLFLGRLVDTKGIMPLLDAWDELFARLGQRTPLLHIAGEGPLEQALHQRARSNPYIGSLGQIGGETKREAIRRCRAMIVPSLWWEPLGLVVYEAYDFSKPVLAAKTGGLAEIVQHGTTGLQHEPGSTAEIVRDVLQMEATPAAERMVMGHNGRQWLLKEADTQVWLQRFEEILATALTA